MTNENREFDIADLDNISPVGRISEA